MIENPYLTITNNKKRLSQQLGFADKINALAMIDLAKAKLLNLSDAAKDFYKIQANQLHIDNLVFADHNDLKIEYRYKQVKCHISKEGFRYVRDKVKVDYNEKQMKYRKSEYMKSPIYGEVKND